LATVRSRFLQSYITSSYPPHIPALSARCALKTPTTPPPPHLLQQKNLGTHIHTYTVQLRSLNPFNFTKDEAPEPPPPRVLRYRRTCWPHLLRYLPEWLRRCCRRVLFCGRCGLRDGSCGGCCCCSGYLSVQFCFWHMLRYLCWCHSPRSDSLGLGPASISSLVCYVLTNP